jgi:UDP-N-acetylmuramate dehydrogenase
MNFQQNVSLKPYNTFGIAVSAEWFGTCSCPEEWAESLQVAADKKMSVYILGGGSNVLFTRNVEGLVLQNTLPGISVVKEEEEVYHVKAGGGVNWHSFVMHCVQNGYAGVENLSLIPGSVGAGPIQNIGAYGVELKDVFHSLTALHRKTGQIKVFSLSECEFDYRSSIFKTHARDEFVILDVTFLLRKKPVFNISYGAMEQELEKMGVKDLSLRAVSDAVIRIRRSKLPDPVQIGNAGSFFKNPSIPSALFTRLKAEYPDIPGYPSTREGYVKIAAGWLIEQCGWKGYRKNDFGVHKNQALVLVNYGQASGEEIYSLSNEIIESVKEKFDIVLEREVNVY